MKTSLALWMVLVLTTAASSAEPIFVPVDMPSVEQLERQGFTPLFNGRDLTGWNVPQGDNGHWKVLDGVIDYDAQSEARGNKSLFTTAEFGDYAFYFEWRFKKHSGLYPMPTILPDGSLKTGADGKPIVKPTPNSDSGLLLRGGRHQANLWCWACGSGELWSVRNSRTATPEQRAAAVPKARADRPVGEWNRMMVTMKGDRVTIVLNGLEVISNAAIPGIAPRGQIGLQHHGGRLSARQIRRMRERGVDVPDDAMSPASSLVQFRNLFVKRLSSSAADADDGWITLFDGSDLDQWRMGPDRSWVVQDGVIALKREFDGKEHNLDYLWIRKPYGDFVLELEYKVPARANSGVFLRTANLMDPVYTGIEVQVANSYGREGLSRGGTAGAIYDCAAPTRNAARKPGEWNRYVITCKRAKVTVVLNGEKVNEMNLDSWTEPNRNPDGSKNKFPVALKDFARRGYVGLQDHGRPIWYRNIRIKPLGGGS